MKSFVALTLLLAVLGVLRPIAAQQQTQVTGTVTDRSGAALAGVQITVTSESDPQRRFETTTGADGRFSIAVPVGVYTIEAALPGFSVSARSGVELSVGQARTIDFRLSIPGLTTAKPPEPESIAVVPVYFATDRASTTPTAFVTHRTPDNVVRYGRFDVSVPVNHKEGQIERPRWWFQGEKLADHFVIIRRQAFLADAFFTDLKSAIGRTTARDVLVFIHGFNNKFEEAIFKTAQVSYDIQFDGASILYSWPAGKGAEVLGYNGDRADADWTADHLAAFLANLLQRSTASRIHVIAHSMGNYAMMRALQKLPPGEQGRITSVFLAAPDIDRDLFRNEGAVFASIAQHPTLYASKNDRALKLSKKLQGGYRRAGDPADGIVVVSGVDSIDVSALDTDFIGHAYFQKNTSVITDIRRVIKEALFQPSRRGLRQMGAAPSMWWLFVKP
jgi:esterase/lipase superfamily enzyme